MIFRSSLRRVRVGFTLIELLVVIGIIILLVGLTTSAVMRFKSTGPQLATRSNLKNLLGKVNTQWKAVRDKAQAENIPSIATPLLGFPLADPRARSTYVGLKLAQAFPVSFDEIMNDTVANGRLPAWPAYKAYLTTLGVTSANATTIVPANIQQAICLMMVVERGPNNLAITQESLGSTGTKSFSVGTAKVFGIADAFGAPLTFSRGSNGPVITSTNLPPGDTLNV